MIEPEEVAVYIVVLELLKAIEQAHDGWLSIDKFPGKVGETLLGMGWVERKRHPGGKRWSGYVLTEKGRDFLAEE